MLVGVGFDLVDVSLFKEDFEHHETAIARTFSKSEIEYCFSTTAPFQGLSARFAAKEAFMKAIGTGSTDDVHFHEITVVHDAAGKPMLHLEGGAAIAHQSLGSPRVLISITHMQAVAGAVVILDL